MANEMNMQLGVQFQLLKTSLIAVYEKQGTTNRFLLSPMNIEELTQVTLDDMLNDFKSAFATIDIEKIQSNIKSIKGIKLDQLKFALRMAYIYIDGDIKEYAFAIEIDCGDAVPDLGFLNVEKLSFAIWNTSRNKVLTQMHLDTIENLVKLLN